VDCISSAAAYQRVVARIAMEIVPAGATALEIVAETAGNIVVASEAEQRVARVGARERVVFGIADDGHTGTTRSHFSHLLNPRAQTRYEVCFMPVKYPCSIELHLHPFLNILVLGQVMVSPMIIKMRDRDH
jgi:hypothetical protein